MLSYLYEYWGNVDMLTFSYNAVNADVFTVAVEK